MGLARTMEAASVGALGQVSVVVMAGTSSSELASELAMGLTSELASELAMGRQWNGT